MKKILGVLFAVAMVCTFAASTYAACGDDGLVALWPFNGNANDASDCGNDGTVYGATLTEDRDGNPDSAYDFDGVDDYVNAGCGYPSTQQLLDVSLAAWIKLDDNTGTHSIIDKNAGQCPEFHYGFGLRVEDGKLWGWCHQDGWWPWASSLETVPINTWTHVAVTCKYIAYKERDIHLYIDGQNTPIGAQDLGMTALSLPEVYIGGFPGGSSACFDGTIEEVAVYDRVLTPQDICQLHHEPLPQEANCSDGIDDDCDGLIDGDDPDCGGYPATANAEAATYGSNSLTGSGIFNEFILVCIPIGAVVFLRIFRRKT